MQVWAPGNGVLGLWDIGIAVHVLGHWNPDAHGKSALRCIFLSSWKRSLFEGICETGSLYNPPRDRIRVLTRRTALSPGPIFQNNNPKGSSYRNNGNWVLYTL